MTKNVLVCGATGFIGRNIVESLAENPEYNVTGTFFNTAPPSGSQLKYHCVDLTDPKQVGEILEGVDIVIQAAAKTTGSKDVIERPYVHVTDNAVMNSLLLRECYEQEISQFIFFSCTVMYQSENNPIIELPLLETDFNPSEEINSKYFGVAWTKVYLEKMCEFYSRLGRTKHIVIRHSNIYGPFDKYDLNNSHVFGATITKVMTATDRTITVWGEGTEARDLLYISDLVDFVEKTIGNQKPAFELINIGSGKAISIKDLVQKIIKISGKSLEIVFDKSKPTIATSLKLNCDKAKVEYNWKPEVSLDLGIKKTIDWYVENIHQEQ